MAAAAFLWHAVTNAMEHYDYSTATFLCERLVAELSAVSAINAQNGQVDVAQGQIDFMAAQHLLATCYYRSGKVNRAYTLLHAAKLPAAESRFLLAQCCFELERNSEALLTLLGDQAILDSVLNKVPFASSQQSLTEAAVAAFHQRQEREREKNVPLGAHGFNLLGRVCKRMSRIEHAVHYFKRSLEMDTFMWSSYEALCQLGHEMEADALFNANVSSVSSAARESGTDGAQLPVGALPALHIPPVPLFEAPQSAHAPQQQQQRAVPPPTTGGAFARNLSFNSNAAAIATPGLPSRTPAQKLTFVTPAPGSAAVSRVAPGSVAASTPFGMGAPDYNTPPVVVKAATGVPVAPVAGAKRAPTARKAQPASATAGARRILAGNLADAADSSASDAETTLAAVDEQDAGEEKDVDDSAADWAPTSNIPETPGIALAATPAKSKGKKLARALTPSASPDKRQEKRQKNRHGVPAPLTTPAAAATPAQAAMNDSDVISTPMPNAPASAANFKSAQSKTALTAASPTSVEVENVRQSLESSSLRRQSSAGSPSGPATSSRPPHHPHAAQAVSLQRDLNASDAADVMETSDSEPSERKNAQASRGMASTGVKFAATPSSESDAVVAAVQQQSGFDIQESQVHLQALGDLLRSMATAYRRLCLYQCKEAMELFGALPAQHLNTAWVLSNLGRCAFEMNDYPKSVHFFQLARKADESRVAGLEYYSVALWHLKREVELSYLAQQVTQLDPNAAETWLVVGNCFSLQKEHDLSLKFFKRATALDPSHAYGFTLAAHELVSNEEYDKAVSLYRMALAVDSRHYNAWYGLGTIAYRQERYSEAIYYFQRALSIHPRCAVLHCYLGMVLHASKNYEQALASLSRADQLDPTNPLPKFQKANVYVTLQQWEAALAELEVVLQLAPREASVHFLLGRIYKKLNMTDKAMLRFVAALDLDPKDRNLVKAAIDSLHAQAGGVEDGADDGF